MKDAQFNKLFVFTCSLVPAVMIAIDYLDGRINDAPTLLHNTGICTLIFLALSLLVTPLRRLTGKNHWSLYRRMLGLYAFFYCCLHLLIFAFIRQGGNWGSIWSEITRGLNLNLDGIKHNFAAGTRLSNIAYDILNKNYILLGLAAFLLMVPLAATSTTWAIKKMGNKKWIRLHKLVYLAAVCAAAHYLYTGKFAAAPLKLAFAIVFGVLLLFRLVVWARDRFLPKSPAAVAAK